MQVKSAELFDDLEEEQGKDVKDFKIHKSGALDEFIEKFLSYHKQATSNLGIDEGQFLDRPYKRKVIEEFAQVVSTLNYEDDDFAAVLTYGYFLSYAINMIEEDEITIIINDQLVPDYLGMSLKHKKIIVKGNVGRFAGSYMESGQIIVHGYAGSELGERMSGGLIHVMNCAEHLTGNCMSGGKIIVEEDVGWGTALEGVGGEIHVKGEIDKEFFKCSSRTKTRIYHKGVLINPKR